VSYPEKRFNQGPIQVGSFLFFINNHRHAVRIGLWRIGTSCLIRTWGLTNDITSYHNPWAKLTLDTIFGGSTAQI
jgi:hypothetical protein